MTLNEVSPPGWGHTKAEKEKTKPNKPKSKIGGSAAAFKRALDDGRFKGLPGSKTKKEKTADMFKLMWSMKNKGDKPHYKPGTDEKKKKYQEEEFVAEREDSPYEKASDKALDKKYGYGTSHDKGPKTGFGRASNRATAAAVLKDIRRRRSKSTSETRADAAHKGWSATAKTSKDQTPEKKATRKKLADTPYKKLPKDEKEKDQVAADAVKKEYDKKKYQTEAVKGQDTDSRKEGAKERATEKKAEVDFRRRGPSGGKKRPLYSTTRHTKSDAEAYATQQKQSIKWHDKRTKGKFIPGTTTEETSMPNVKEKDRGAINKRFKGLFKKDVKGTVQGVNESEYEKLKEKIGSKEKHDKPAYKDFVKKARKK